MIILSFSSKKTAPEIGCDLQFLNLFIYKFTHLIIHYRIGKPAGFLR